MLIFLGKWLGTPDLTQCQSYWLQKLRQQLDKQASIVHVANDLTHYTASFRPLSPGDLLLLIDTIEVMTTRMKNDLGTIPTLDQRRAVITEVVQVSVLFSVMGRNHVHLTVRLGFVTQHLWLGDFGKCNQGLRAQTLRLRYPKSSVTSPLS